MSNAVKTIGIVGLGLIGGSMAKVLHQKTNYLIYGCDQDEAITKHAIADGTINQPLTTENLKEVDCVILCIYPQGTVNYVTQNISNFKKECVIVDCAGVKTQVCKKLSPLCAKKGLYFVGGHPMAGMQKSGYDNSTADLFDGASMILCQDNDTNPIAFGFLNKLFLELGFGKITTATPAEHDNMIAFTSQLPHVVSNAFVQSPTAEKRLGFSGGSYRDLTRVAYLNEDMWSQLFLENADPLAEEIRDLATRLNQYAQLIEDRNLTELKELLKKGKEIKERIG